jgi:hypothetical protein
MFVHAHIQSRLRNTVGTRHAVSVQRGECLADAVVEEHGFIVDRS